MIAPDNLKVLSRRATKFCTETQIPQLPTGNIVENTMNLQAPIPNRLLDHIITQKCINPKLDIQLRQANSSRTIISNALQLRFVRSPNSFQWGEPCVQHSTDSGVAESRAGGTAASVTAQNNVLDLQVNDSVLDNRGGVDVGWGDQVADVTVDEDIAGFETEKGSFGDPRIGATEPNCSLLTDALYFLRKEGKEGKEVEVYHLRKREEGWDWTRAHIRIEGLCPWESF
jgi:hypothetical protein